MADVGSRHSSSAFAQSAGEAAELDAAAAVAGRPAATASSGTGFSGVGGPWHQTAVVANQPSDPYLMTGYDRKRLTVWSDHDTQITVEVDVDHQSGWHRYQVFDVVAGQPLEHEFPEWFSAHWVRLQSSQAATVTAVFRYE